MSEEGIILGEEAVAGCIRRARRSEEKGTTR